MYNILICDNDKESVESLITYLTLNDYCVFHASNSEQAMQILKEEEICLMLIDTAQKEMGGFRTIMEIRMFSHIPIMIVSTADEKYELITGLNIGADDYITKPYSFLELIARINSQIRRYTKLSGMCDQVSKIYRVDGLEIDDERRRVTVDGREVKLTPLEYKILSLLVKQRGKVFSIDQIYESIWQMRAVCADNTIAVHIRHIREKIEENPKEPRYLKVIWGTGYKVG